MLKTLDSYVFGVDDDSRWRCAKALILPSTFYSGMHSNLLLLLYNLLGVHNWKSAAFYI